MQLNFTVNCVLDIPKQTFTAQVVSVVTPHDEDITRHFLDFCRANQLPLSSEDEIRAAMHVFGKEYYT